MIRKYISFLTISFIFITGMVHGVKFEDGLNTTRIDKFVCLNGTDPSKISKKEYLIEFGKGPCNPLMIVPGLYSSVLVVEIDCPVLQREHPEIMETCGWNACQKESYEFWKEVPRSEYRVWIPGLTTPLNIFTFSKEKNTCWGRFFKVDLDINKPFEDMIIPPKGFKIKTYGSTPKTHGRSRCGDLSITNLLGNYAESKATEPFSSLQAHLKKLGYIPGLTYQSLPYDFRLSYRNNQLKVSFSDNLVRLFVLTGKKVNIVSHSLGTVNTFYQLSTLTQEQKDKMIKNWVMVGGPLLGALKTLRIIVSGDNDFTFLDDIIGIHLGTSVSTFNKLPTIYELQPLDPFTLFKNEPWFELIRLRMLYEQGKITYQETGMDYLPRIEEKCGYASFKGFNPSCKFEFADTSEGFVVKVMDDEYKLGELKDLFTKWQLTDDEDYLYQKSINPEMLQINNPNVPIVSVILRSVKTPYKYVYSDDIKQHYQNNTEIPTQVIYGRGDGTISTYSSVFPLFKWAFEFENRTGHAKPIKIVEMCSEFNNKNTVYDSVAKGEGLVFTKNEYQSIHCECKGKSSAESCSHQYMPGDAGFLGLLSNILFSWETNDSQNYVHFINGLTNEYLEEITISCPQIKDELWDNAESDLNKEWAAAEEI